MLQRFRKVVLCGNKNSGATVTAGLASGFAAVALWQFADCRVDPTWSDAPTEDDE